MTVPSVFVGSSTAGLRIAQEIQSQLADAGEVELWNEGVFALGTGTLESLIALIKDGQQQYSARDNVLIDVGLFMGRLARERTFLLCCKDDDLSKMRDPQVIIP